MHIAEYFFSSNFATVALFESMFLLSFNLNWLTLEQSDDSWGQFYWHGLTSIPASISNYTHYNVWGEITYPFFNFNVISSHT